jgi:hypothetical protein
MSDCEKTIHNSQFLMDDKCRSFSFLSRIFLNLFNDGINKGYQQKPTGVLLSRGSFWSRSPCTIICSSNLSELHLLEKMKNWKPDYKRNRLLSSTLIRLQYIGAHFEIFLQKATGKKPFLKSKQKAKISLKNG